MRTFLRVPVQNIKTLKAYNKTDETTFRTRLLEGTVCNKAKGTTCCVLQYFDLLFLWIFALCFCFYVLDQCTKPFMRLTSYLWGVLLCNAQLSLIKNRLIDVVFQIFNTQVFYYLYHMIRWLYFTVQAKLRLICKRVSARCVCNNVVVLLSNNLRRTKAIYVKVHRLQSRDPNDQ